MKLFKRKNYIPLTSRTQAVQKPRQEKEDITETPAIPDGMWVKAAPVKSWWRKKKWTSIRYAQNAEVISV